MAFQIGPATTGIPSYFSIQALLGESFLHYPMARGLWVNAAVPVNVTVNESQLLRCFGSDGDTAMIDDIMLRSKFVPVPTGVIRNRTCPAGLP
jgi:hypothetical protein